MESRIIFNDDYLEHHGILGQKWGVRRYQNKDGSLTSAGKKKYAYEHLNSKDRDLYEKTYRSYKINKITSKIPSIKNTLVKGTAAYIFGYQFVNNMKSADKLYNLNIKDPKVVAASAKGAAAVSTGMLYNYNKGRTLNDIGLGFYAYNAKKQADSQKEILENLDRKAKRNAAKEEQNGGAN